MFLLLHVRHVCTLYLFLSVAERADKIERELDASAKRETSRGE